MKALSIRPKYADEIARGEKIEEYRTWKTAYRGDLLICASAYNHGAAYVRGHALCIVELFDIERDTFNNDYAWKLRNVRFIDPFPVKGKLHLYEVDNALIKPLSIDYHEARRLWQDRGLCHKPRCITLETFKTIEKHGATSQNSQTPLTRAY